MKKLVNRPSDVVREMLEGIARQSPHVAILGDEHVLVRQPLPEPALARIAASTASVDGDVNTSPQTAALSIPSPT